MTELVDTLGRSLNPGLKMSRLNAETKGRGNVASTFTNLTTQLRSNRPGTYATGAPNHSWAAWEGFLEEVTSWASGGLGLEGSQRGGGVRSFQAKGGHDV